jgi:hypothetical protein
VTRAQPTLMARTAHGTGADALLRVERPGFKDMPPMNAGDTAQGLAIAAARGRPFTADNEAAKGKRPALASLGVRIGTADPRYVSALRKAKRYVDRRRRELTVMCGGGLSSGPCAMLASAGRALAASVLLYELAGETLNAKLFAQAARLADQARQQELTAVALAEREAAAQRSLGGPVDFARAMADAAKPREADR